MKLLGTPGDIIDGSVTYIQITCGLIIVQVGYNAVHRCSRRLRFQNTAVLFDSMFLFKYFAGPVLCIGAGDGGCRVAWATIISQGIAALLSFVYMRRKYAMLRFGRQEMVLDKKIMGDYLRYGLPMGLTSCLLSVGMLVITSVINSFGSSVVAAYTVGSKVENIAVLLFNSLRCHFNTRSSVPSTPVRILARGTGTGSILGSARQCGWSSSCRSLRRC